ncbi:hypothetical protein RHMOL_Rhmol08G0191200 [Rhododendron molle]|uniref:Uncharacterized protein n=1 Tax=Rhododendron molle TaxID=49168 RepID=A0ACC0MQA8_RHOML|nr:hypothetical protein RHMOL_Rhmol08G0191200 [Rhododendron molle]
MRPSAMAATTGAMRDSLSHPATTRVVLQVPNSKISSQPHSNCYTERERERGAFHNHGGKGFERAKQSKGHPASLATGVPLSLTNPGRAQIPLSFCIAKHRRGRGGEQVWGLGKSGDKSPIQTDSKRISWFRSTNPTNELLSILNMPCLP